MLTVWINKAQFEYDIHSLVKAFYPEEEVKVLRAEGEKQDHRIAIEFGETSIKMTLKKEPQAEVRVSEISHSPDADRQTVKNLLKQLIYNSLSKLLGKKLPWGTLTGIRPTKIPMTMLEEGKGEAQIMSFMQDTISSAKKKAF